MQTVDVIVVGLGAMGAATTYQLAKAGHSVIGIDRLDPPHSFGSSHGDTRITRFLYNYGPQVPLVVRSHEIWNDLEAETGVTLFTRTGGLFVGNDDGPDSWITGCIAEARAQNIDHEVLSTAGIRQRFPAFDVPDDAVGLFDVASGVLRPEECIRTQLSGAERMGAALKRNEQVLSIDETRDHVTVQTDGAAYRAERVVLTSGPWIGEFLDGELAEFIKTYRQVLYWFDIESSYEQFTPDRFPVFVWQIGSSSHDMFYGFPAFDGAAGGLKIATDQYDVPSDHVRLKREVDPGEIAEMYEQYGSLIQGLNAKVVKAVTCTYTVTKDRDYLIDWKPGSERTLLVSACMGRGFKHSAALGEAAAQLATTGRSDIDLSPYRLADRLISR